MMAHCLSAQCRGETLSSITILTEPLAPSLAVMTVLFVNMRKLQVCLPTFGDTFVIIRWIIIGPVAQIISSKTISNFNFSMICPFLCLMMTSGESDWRLYNDGEEGGPGQVISITEWATLCPSHTPPGQGKSLQLIFMISTLSININLT